jgi:hypothetical protein
MSLLDDFKLPFSEPGTTPRWAKGNKNSCDDVMIFTGEPLAPGYSNSKCEASIDNTRTPMTPTTPYNVSRVGPNLETPKSSHRSIVAASTPRTPRLAVDLGVDDGELKMDEELYQLRVPSKFALSPMVSPRASKLAATEVAKEVATMRKLALEGIE